MKQSGCLGGDEQRRHIHLFEWMNMWPARVVMATSFAGARSASTSLDHCPDACRHHSQKSRSRAVNSSAEAVGCWLWRRKNSICACCAG